MVLESFLMVGSVTWIGSALTSDSLQCLCDGVGVFLMV